MVGAWLVTLLTFSYAGIASFFILIPTDATIATYSGISRSTYEITQIVPLIVIVLICLVFYVWGRMESRNQDIVVQVPVGTGERPSSLGGLGSLEATGD